MVLDELRIDGRLKLWLVGASPMRLSAWPLPLLLPAYILLSGHGRFLLFFIVMATLWPSITSCRNLCVCHAELSQVRCLGGRVGLKTKSKLATSSLTVLRTAGLAWIFRLSAVSETLRFKKETTASQETDALCVMNVASAQNAGSFA